MSEKEISENDRIFSCQTGFTYSQMNHLISWWTFYGDGFATGVQSKAMLRGAIALLFFERG
jgi:hypothetical protein